MPIFNYTCPKCKKKKIDEFVRSWDDDVRCEDCDVVMIKSYSGFPVPHVFPSEGIFLEHVSANGHLFHSKAEMKQYAKDHDLELGAL